MDARDLINPSDSPERRLEKMIRINSALMRRVEHPGSARFDADTRTATVQKLATLADDQLSKNAATVRESVRQRFCENVRISETSSTQLSDQQKQIKTPYRRGRRELEHEFGKSMRYKSIRELADGDSGNVIRDLKPVWLMSPLSVSDTLPLTDEYFDAVIFDEASQITLEDAVPALYRAGQAIIVGDEMQLPPTSFFATRRDMNCNNGFNNIMKYLSCFVFI